MKLSQQNIIEKNGIKFIKLNPNKFNLTFDMNNDNIILSSLINFDLIHLIQKLNPTIFEKMTIDHKSDTNVIMNVLLHDIFADLGLPHYYLALNINKEIIDSTNFTFNCCQFASASIYSKLEIYPDDVELIPIQKFDICFTIINNHNIKINCDIYLTDNHNIPIFFDKMIGNILYNIFNRLKQFIENVSF